tara:strand:+ start:1393 stop:1578 length:186 start_codon:yes stop_codon:yes gene_type:complete
MDFCPANQLSDAPLTAGLPGDKPDYAISSDFVTVLAHAGVKNVQKIYHIFTMVAPKRFGNK